MAYRRFLTTLTRQTYSLIFSTPHHHYPLKTLIPYLPSLHHFPQFFTPKLYPRSLPSHSFCSIPNDPQITDPEQENDVSEGESDCEDGRGGPISRAYSIEEKIEEAAEIGYKVVGPLEPKDRVFKPHEPVFAVVQIGSHQFKVSGGDCIYVEKLKHCDVNDKLILNKVLVMGSPNQTIIGRPILPDAAVHAVVEEHALDAKVIIFKKKRRKNYRRTKGHRQELTRLRITDIQGIEKPETTSSPGNTLKISSSKMEKVAVAA